MEKQHNHRIFQGRKFFKCIWILASIIFLILIISYNWYFTQKNNQQALQIRAQNTQDMVERFLDNLLQTIYSLPIYGQHFSDCKSKLEPALQQAIFNNPNVSGLVISSNNKILCSTLPHNYNLLPIKDRAQTTLLGPIVFEKNQEPFFVLQQRLGSSYHVSLYFAETILKEHLKPYLAPHNYILLYDQKNKKTLTLVTDQHYPYFNSLKYPFAISKLQLLNNIAVVVGSNPRLVLQSFISSSLVIGLILASLALVLYSLVRKFLIKHFSLYSHLKFAIKNNHFFPVYQPIYNTKQQCFQGAEVLLRWQTADGDILTPESFIAEAEKTELIVDITLQIADIALQDFAQVLKPTKSFYLAFNISAYHFISNDFFIKFSELIKKYQLEPRQIMLELTERDIINKNNVVFSNKMQQLREQGFLLAIDDFGTGHANISYLQQFPFNYLKIDRIFVQAIGTGSVTELLIDAIISMAKTLRLQIIAEGIEKIEQVHYLEANDVQYLQGWYYAKAMTIMELRQLL